MRGGQSHCRFFEQRTRGMKASGTKGGLTHHGSTQQLSRPRKVCRLAAHPLGHIKGVRSPASQQQRADVCVSDVEPHVRSVERACRNGISRVRNGHGFNGAPGIRRDGNQDPRYLSANDWRQVVQRELFGRVDRRIRLVRRKPVHREEGVNIAAGLR